MSYTGTIFDLEGKVAIVTGGSRGIGRSISLGLAEAGADVVATSRNIESVEAVTAEIKKSGRRSIAISTDASSKEDIENVVNKTIEEFGKIDILVNNAGVSHNFKTAESITDEDWDWVINLNLRGQFLFCQEVGKHMREREYGKIVNVVSIVGQVGFARQIVYAAAKGGFIAITKTLALEWNKYNITVNALAPGFVETDMTSALKGSRSEEWILRRTAMKRFGKPEEVVGAAMYLASDASSYTNGVVVTVDGGYLAG